MIVYVWKKKISSAVRELKMRLVMSEGQKKNIKEILYECVYCENSAHLLLVIAKENYSLFDHKMQLMCMKQAFVISTISASRNICYKYHVSL